jgi:hypothetical protein
MRLFKRERERERGEAAEEGQEWPDKLSVGEVDEVDTASGVSGIYVISAPKSFTHMFFFLKYGQSNNLNVKIKGICEFFGT